MLQNVRFFLILHSLNHYYNLYHPTHNSFKSSSNREDIFPSSFLLRKYRDFFGGLFKFRVDRMSLRPQSTRRLPSSDSYLLAKEKAINLLAELPLFLVSDSTYQC